MSARDAEDVRLHAEWRKAEQRAESAEAALAGFITKVEVLASRLLHFDVLNEQVPAHVDVPDDYEAGVNEAGRYLRALLAPTPDREEQP